MAFVFTRGRKGKAEFSHPEVFSWPQKKEVQVALGLNIGEKKKKNKTQGITIIPKETRNTAPVLGS